MRLKSLCKPSSGKGCGGFHKLLFYVLILTIFLTTGFVARNHIDVVILNSRREPTVLRNDSPNKGHWLQVTLRGAKTNRDGVVGISDRLVAHHDGAVASSP